MAQYPFDEFWEEPTVDMTPAEEAPDPYQVYQKIKVCPNVTWHGCDIAGLVGTIMDNKSYLMCDLDYFKYNPVKLLRYECFPIYGEEEDREFERWLEKLADMRRKKTP